MLPLTKLKSLPTDQLIKELSNHRISIMRNLNTFLDCEMQGTESE